MSIESVPVRRLRIHWLLTASLACALGFGLWSVRSSEPAQTSSTADRETANTARDVQAPKQGREAQSSATLPLGAPSSHEPAKTDQPGAPVVESPEVIASMDIAFVAEEVKRIDKELSDRRAVERLNNDEVSDAERLEFGAMMHRVALFRHRLLEHSVESLHQEVDEYGKGHAERLAKYSKNRR